MSGAIRLGLVYAWRHRVQTLIVSLCIAAAVGLPVAAELVLGHYERELSARAESVPLVAGTRGSRFDLAFASLYFRVLPIEPAPLRLYEELAEDPDVLPVPVHARFTARGKPLVAIGADYFDVRGLVAVEGTPPLRIGDAVLGATAAGELELGVGDALFSDQRELYDLSVPPPLKMRVVGVLARTGSADDHAVFTDIETAWVLEGETHGHADEGAIADDLVLARSPEHVAVSPSMTAYNEITDENIASFHVHGDRSVLPITGVLVFPKDAKAQTIIKARINNEGEFQAVEPAQLVGELFDVVFRVKAVFNWIAGLIAVATVLLVALISLLATRLRRDELATLDRIGASGAFRGALVASQLGVSIGLGVLIGLVGAGTVLAAAKSLLYTM